MEGWAGGGMSGSVRNPRLYIYFKLLGSTCH
jgi:hypothetical protein